MQPIRFLCPFAAKKFGCGSTALGGFYVINHIAHSTISPRHNQPSGDTTIINNTPTIAVIGAGGMLGTDIVSELKRRDIPHHAFTRDTCDVTDPESCRRALEQARPDVVINCAAYTNVNRAESEKALAAEINGLGTANVAGSCAAIDAACIYVSTDYVFDGTKTDPWETTDPTNPINAYGRTKLAGEIGVAAELPPDRLLIARTSWLYGANGQNFVQTMLDLARDGKPLRIINDQTGAPTYTVDLARVLVDIAVADVHGIVHATNDGSCTWFEFAKEIFRMSAVRPKSLVPCTSDEFTTPARRPANSVLSARSLEENGIAALPHWQDGLRRYLEEIGALVR